MMVVATKENVWKGTQNTVSAGIRDQLWSETRTIVCSLSTSQRNESTYAGWWNVPTASAHVEKYGDQWRRTALLVW